MSVCYCSQNPSLYREQQQQPPSWQTENVQLPFANLVTNSTNLNNVAVVTFSRHMHIMSCHNNILQGHCSWILEPPMTVVIVFLKNTNKPERIIFIRVGFCTARPVLRADTVPICPKRQLLTIACFVFVSLESANFKQVHKHNCCNLRIYPFSG